MASTRLRNAWRFRRSEEHTSELQSQPNLVCRLVFLKDAATTEIYPLPLPDALPISAASRAAAGSRARRGWPRRVCETRGGSVDRKSTRLNSSHSQISYAALFF